MYWFASNLILHARFTIIVVYIIVLYYNRRCILEDVLAHKNDKNLQLVYEVHIRRDCQVTLTLSHVTLLVTPPPPPFVSWCDSLPNTRHPPPPPRASRIF